MTSITAPEHRPVKELLRAGACVLWLIYSAATLLGNELILNIFSPLTALFSSILIVTSLKDLGAFRYTGMFFFVGVFSWFISDLLLILYTYFFIDDPILTAISDQLYLLPNYMIFISAIAYSYTVLKKGDFYRVIVDTFGIAYTIYVIIINVFMSDIDIDASTDLSTLSLMMYFLAALFVLTLLAMISLETNQSRHNGKFFIIAVIVFIYELLEVRYTYYMTLELDPENIYLDIIYLGAIMIISLLLSSIKTEAQKPADFGKFPIYHFKPMQKAYMWINGALISLIGVVLFAMSFITSTELYGMFIVALAYIVVQKNMESEDLYTALLDLQKNENARLEQLVREKTQELQYVNDYLEKTSNIDALTGLYNRRYFGFYEKTIFSSSNRNKAAVFSIDLNYFKPINDNYGHDVGDYTLKEISKRLYSIFPECCTLFRMGGDEFLLVYDQSADISSDFNEKVIGIANRICTETDKQIIMKRENADDLTLTISASIGIALYPEHSTDVDEILRAADSAMYETKHKFIGSSFKIYEKNSEA
ncbi:MAG: GGDEF domain-containing protein [Oscillospiraceae bacterium]|nr:GGDEF domain-containing protein [Oscillospiraceae bacterium]